MVRQSTALLLVFGLFLPLASGCNIDHPGEAPPRGKLYFPTALAISAQEPGQPARHLFVVNSNFDLAFNAGSLQVFDLEELDGRIAGCTASEECIVPASEVMADEVLVGSFGVGLAISASGTRIYLATRGDPALTYIDVEPEPGDDGLLDCGQAPGRRCDDDHVRSSQGDLEMPPEPVGLIAGPMNDFDDEADAADQYVMVAHRVGAVSLFRDSSLRDDGPELLGLLEGIRERLTGIGFDPHTALAYLTSWDLSNTIQAKALDRVGLSFAGQDTFAYDAGPLWLTGISYDRDTREVAFAPEDLPGKALVVARVPSSLIIADTTASRSDASWTTASVVTEVGSGASRVAVGRIGADGKLFAFVSCFNSRELFVIDTGLGEPVAVLRGFSGPFDLALDRWRERLYVADFRSSTIRVVDLRPLVCDPDDADTACDAVAPASGSGLPCRCLQSREPGITATLGEPSLPTELI